MESEALDNTIESLQNEIAMLKGECEQYQKVITEMQKAWEEFHGLISTWETEKAALQSAVNRKAGFEPYRSWSGGFEVWQKYYRENYNAITQIISDLKRDLDKESIETIDLITERNFHVFPQQKYIDYFLINHRGLMTDKEHIRPQYDMQSLREIRDKYHLPDNYFPETTVMTYHSGLTLLPDNVQKTVNGRDVIDGGALCGDSSLMFCPYSPGKVYAFEPHPQNFHNLVNVVKANKLSDVIIPVNLGLGDKSESSKLFCYDGGVVSSNMGGMSHSMSARDKVTEVPMNVTTIDEFSAEHDLDVALIKLDIEGNELATIRGAINTIKKCRPILLIALYHTPQDFFEIKPIIEHLNPDYKFMIRKLSFTEYELVTELTLIGYVDNG
jgi:FkbM family methyltransferase